MALIFFLVLVLPISAMLILAWLFTEKKIFRNLLVYFWGGMFLIWLSSLAVQPFFQKKVLKKSDLYGEYVIDRDFFPGKQADWQYNHFRFEIKENDSIFFYETQGKEIIKTYRGVISTLPVYKSARLVIKMESPGHHILSENPTIYREVWGFYLVFKSLKFYNVFFRKGKWVEID